MQARLGCVGSSMQSQFNGTLCAVCSLCQSHSRLCAAGGTQVGPSIVGSAHGTWGQHRECTACSAPLDLPAHWLRGWPGSVQQGVACSICPGLAPGATCKASLRIGLVHATCGVWAGPSLSGGTHGTGASTRHTLHVALSPAGWALCAGSGTAQSWLAPEPALKSWSGMGATCSVGLQAVPVALGSTCMPDQLCTPVGLRPADQCAWLHGPDPAHRPYVWHP